MINLAPWDLADLLKFALLTGLRPQELRTLQQDQVRADANGRLYVHIEAHKTAKSARTHRPRTASLSAMAEAIVQRQIERHPASPWVFVNAEGTQHTRYTLRNRIRRVC